jgi:hypothetical protein
MFIIESLNDRKIKSIAGAFFAILMFYGALRWAGRTTEALILGGFSFVLVVFLFFVFQFWYFYVDNPYLMN